MKLYNRSRNAFRGAVLSATLLAIIAYAMFKRPEPREEAAPAPYPVPVQDHIGYIAQRWNEYKPLELKLSGDIPAWLKPAYAVDGLDWLVEMGNDFKKRRIQRELQPLAEDLLRIHKIPIPQGWDVQVPPDSSEGQQGPVAEVNIVPKGESNFYTGQGTVVHFVLKKNEVKVTDFDRGGEIVKKETQILKSGE